MVVSPSSVRADPAREWNMPDVSATNCRPIRRDGENTPDRDRNSKFQAGGGTVGAITSSKRFWGSASTGAARFRHTATCPSASASSRARYRWSPGDRVDRSAGQPRDVVPVVDFGLRAPFDERLQAVAVVGDRCLAAIELLVVEGEFARDSWFNPFEITVQSIRDHVRRLPLVLTIPAKSAERPEFGTKSFSRDGVRNRPISRTG